MKQHRNKRVFIPNSRQLPRPPKPTGVRKVVKEKVPLADAIMNNQNIDVKRLALLVNLCHLVADVNEQLVMDINDILKEADPTLQLQFERPIRQIKNHAAEMVKFVDESTSQEFSAGFGEMADALKDMIINFSIK